MPNAAHVTKKKRETRLNNLAGALGSFLQQWQAQRPKERNSGAKGYSGQTRKVEWQDHPYRQNPKQESNLHQNTYHNDNEQRWSGQDTESSLLSDLLAFLQQCQNKQLTDAEVASQMTSRIAKWKGKGHQYNDKNTGPIKTPVTARENTVPPVTAVKQSEWAATPVFIPKGKVL